MICVYVQINNIHNVVEGYYDSMYLTGIISNEMSITEAMTNIMMDCLPVLLTILFTCLSPRTAESQMKPPMRRKKEKFSYDL